MSDEEIESLDWSLWPAPDDILIELGRMNALWSGFETFMNMCISKLAGHNDFGEIPFILLHHSNFTQRIDMLGSLCSFLAEEYPHLKAHKATIDKIREAQRLRNDFVHNGIDYDHETGILKKAKASARGSIKTRVEKIRKADLRKASIAIDEANRSLYGLVLRNELGPAWERLSQL